VNPREVSPRRGHLTQIPVSQAHGGVRDLACSSRRRRRNRLMHRASPGAGSGDLNAVFVRRNGTAFALSEQ